MQTLTIESPLSEMFTYSEPTLDINIPEVRELSVRQISHYVNKPKFRETGYNTTTYGKIGFTRIEENFVTEDINLQSRLDILCDKLRAKY